MKTRRLVYLALMVALGIIVHYFEGFIPFPVPGFRLGLANIASLFVLYAFGGPAFLFVTITRILLSALLFSGFSVSFFMSLAGGVLSMLLSLLLYYVVRCSIYALSLTSALFHTIGQLIVYAVFFNTPFIFTLLSYLGPLSMLTGILSGLLTALVLSHFPLAYLKDDKRRTR